MGRREKPIWKYFVRFKKSNSIHGKCMFCGQTYFSNALRMERHLTQCEKAPVRIKKLYLQSKNDNDNQSEDYVLSGESIEELDFLETINEASTSSNKSMSIKNRQLSQFLDHMDSKENLVLDTMLARAIFATATSNRFVENTYVKKFIKRLRPSYEIPSRYHISTSLLDKEYNLLKTLVINKINQCDSMTLISDGWTDVNGISLINIIFTTPEPIFYRAIDSQMESHTGEYIASVLASAIEEVKPKKVGAIITDNAKNMRFAWNILKQKYPHIIIYGCVAHGLNLLSKDILSITSISRICAQVKDIIKFFRNKHTPRQVLKEIQLSNLNKEIQLLTFSETRWGSMSNSLESLIKNKDFLQNAVFSKYVKPLLVNSSIKQTILDEDIFWPKVVNILKLLKPIGETIIKVETDKPNLSNVYIQIEKLQRDITENSIFLSKTERDGIETALYNRCKNFIQHTVQFAANLLNPLERGRNLCEENQNEAIEFIAEFAEKYSLDLVKIMSDLANYRAKTDVWSRDTFWRTGQTIDPLTWWKGFFPNRELTKVAIKILSFPATAASAERNWKAYSTIHTKKRNKLKIDRAMKLVYVKFNLELFKDNDMNELTKNLATEKTLSENLINESISGNPTESELSSEDDGSDVIFFDNIEDFYSENENEEEPEFYVGNVVDDHDGENLMEQTDNTVTILEYENENCNNRDLEVVIPTEKNILQMYESTATNETETALANTKENEKQDINKIIYINAAGNILGLSSGYNQ